MQESAYLKLVAWVDRLPHALLLHGPRGTGKLELAERFSQYLLCESRTKSRGACGRCDACRWVLAGNHPDLRLLEPESLGRVAPPEDDERAAEEGARAKRKPSEVVTIDQVRELGEFLHMGTHRAGRKIAIIHPAESMQGPAANALLKNLEEPPGNSLIVLVAHRPAQLAATIRSRCVQVAVSVPGESAALRWLQERGVRDAPEWLAYAGGAPARAAELATGEHAERIAAWRQALESGELAALAPGRERGEVEALVEVAQRFALDRALQAFGQVSKYSRKPSGGADAAEARRWLAFARRLCRSRALARHPLNPKLFVEDLLADFPARGR